MRVPRHRRLVSLSLLLAAELSASCLSQEPQTIIEAESAVLFGQAEAIPDPYASGYECVRIGEEAGGIEFDLPPRAPASTSIWLRHRNTRPVTFVVMVGTDGFRLDVDPASTWHNTPVVVPPLRPGTHISVYTTSAADLDNVALASPCLGCSIADMRVHFPGVDGDGKPQPPKGGSPVPGQPGAYDMWGLDLTGGVRLPRATTIHRLSNLQFSAVGNRCTGTTPHCTPSNCRIKMGATIEIKCAVSLISDWWVWKSDEGRQEVTTGSTFRVSRDKTVACGQDFKVNINRRNGWQRQDWYAKGRCLACF
jgi:hypothetical protein